jgi:hypothetical protein
MRKPIFALFLIGIVTTSLWSPRPAQAVDYLFNSDFILSDEEMTDVDTMTIADVQAFLISRGSGLAHLRLTDYQGIIRPASEIIWNAAQESRINPQVILTTLQKEQSLISNPTPSERALQRAMGYRCPDGDACNASTLDFGKQVDGATWQFRQYLDNPTKWSFQAGRTSIVDGSRIVTPVTRATAGLYNYTPHISGNEQFWRLWVKYWGKNFPNGSLLKARGNPAVWFIDNGYRRLITSYSALTSRFDPRKILQIEPADLQKYEVGASLRFPNYSLLRTPDGNIYLLVDDQLRHIDSMEAFRTIGFTLDEVQEIGFSDTIGYAPGVDITVETIYPTGTLLKTRDSAQVYYVIDGKKHAVVAPEILHTKFPTLSVEVVASSTLAEYPEAEPVKFRDGELIKGAGDPKVYVISGGMRRWIPTGELFVKLGYRWDNIINTSAAALAVQPEGEPIE